MVPSSRMRHVGRPQRDEIPKELPRCGHVPGWRPNCSQCSKHSCCRYCWQVKDSSTDKAPWPMADPVSDCGAACLSPCSHHPASQHPGPCHGGQEGGGVPLPVRHPIAECPMRLHFVQPWRSLQSLAL
jgi:hypothetical protein